MIVERDSFVVTHERNVVVHQVHLLLDLMSGERSRRRHHHWGMLVIVNGVVVIRRNIFIGVDVDVDVVVVVGHHLMVVERYFLLKVSAASHLLLVHDCKRTSSLWRWRWHRPIRLFWLIFNRQLSHFFVQLRQHLIGVCVVHCNLCQVLSLRCEACHLGVFRW